MRTQSIEDHQEITHGRFDTITCKRRGSSPISDLPMSVTVPTIQIQEIETVPQMKVLEKLQQEVWGWSDLDTTPLMDFIILKELGGTLIGAFEGERVVGFAFGFVGYHDEQVVFHSHMLAVHPSYRQCGLGLRLKHAQRTAALERGFDRITWTFDPLQSTNAHLNCHKLRVVANRYRVNFYGEQSSSMLHRYIGTDRLWVDWFLNSQRVVESIEGRPYKNWNATDLEDAERLIEIGLDGLAVYQTVNLHAGKNIVIEIPTNIALLQQQHPEVAVAWRNATRSAFVEAFAAGYVVDDFLRMEKNRDESACYVLIPTRHNEID